jgi:hypothetical protein
MKVFEFLVEETGGCFGTNDERQAGSEEEEEEEEGEGERKVMTGERNDGLVMLFMLICCWASSSRNLCRNGRTTTVQ